MDPTPTTGQSPLGATPAVSLLVLPSYQAPVDATLLAELSQQGIPAQLVCVYADPSQGDWRVESPSAAFPGYRCYTPAVTTPFMAMLFGLCYCNADKVVLASGGIRLTSERVTALLDTMRQTGAEVVSAARSSRRYPWRQRLLSVAVRAYLRLIAGFPLADPRSGLRLFQRAALTDLIRHAQRSGTPFDPHDLLLVPFQGRWRVAEVLTDAEFVGAPFPISRALARHVLLLLPRRLVSASRPSRNRAP